MKNKIAIIYTTFLRDDLMYRTVNSILANWSDRYFLFIADQGRKTEEKEQFYKSLPTNKVAYYYLDFDCGLSIARNFLVKTAKIKGYSFCLLTADSILITKPFSLLEQGIDFLNLQKNYGILGFKLINRASWEKLIRKNGLEDKFIITNATEIQQFFNLEFLRCDIVRNFFLAKTECLYQNQWDNDLKLCEHEIFFWTLKTHTFWKVFYSEFYEATYINSNTPEYAIMRKRLYSQFCQLMLKKYNLHSWLKEDK